MFRRLATVLSASTLLLVGTALPAAAEVGPPAPPNELPPRAHLVEHDDHVSGTANETGGVITPQTHVTSCLGTSTVPEHSGRNATSRAQTECPWIADNIYVYGELQRHRWYDWQRLDDNQRRLFNDYLTGVSLGYTCQGQGTYTYRTTGYHEAIDAGHEGSVETQSEQHRFTC